MHWEPSARASEYVYVLLLLLPCCCSACRYCCYTVVLYM
jgi:hypothetical protein